MFNDYQDGSGSGKLNVGQLWDIPKNMFVDKKEL